MFKFYDIFVDMHILSVFVNKIMNKLNMYKYLLCTHVCIKRFLMFILLFHTCTVIMTILCVCLYRIAACTKTVEIRAGTHTCRYLLTYV